MIVVTCATGKLGRLVIHALPLAFWTAKAAYEKSTGADK
jgi:uncharacterized protein YbjT (DUF2867 family)